VSLDIPPVCVGAMPYVPAKGSTLLIPSGSDGNPEGLHLFVILTDRCNEGMHLLVNFATVRPDRYVDQTCIVEAGEHEFLKAKSFVHYRHARTDRAELLTKCVDGWTFKPKDPVSADLLERIRAGVAASPQTARRVKTYFEGK
jgi:hypothetical protein